MYTLQVDNEWIQSAEIFPGCICVKYFSKSKLGVDRVHTVLILS